jgi:hypothetical protein
MGKHMILERGSKGKGVYRCILFLTVILVMSIDASGKESEVRMAGEKAVMTLVEEGEVRVYELTSTADLRDNRPASKKITIREWSDQARVRSGSLMFDGLYAMAVDEALANSVSEIRDGAYGHGEPLALEAFETGEKWTYVWTRDLAYALHLGLAQFDPGRAVSSMLFKASARKPAIGGGVDEQIIQDTGSGGSYPVSTDRVVWAIGAHETLKYLDGSERRAFLDRIYPILCGTIEQDRVLVYDAESGLYRGEQSFLDWREQTYPLWTRDNVLAIAMSKALSVNVAMFFILERTADYAREKGEPERAERYRGWASKLKDAINREFWDSSSGLYRTYLLSHDGSDHIPVDRYDLLGLSLAILLGVADESQAEKILAGYPVGRYGPPVVWPQNPEVPIYHNQGIWPFVTAYWTRAAARAGNPAAVAAGVQSLHDLAALNLSNMENYDFRSGKAYAEDGDRKGPVINSRRQLWSVAGYLSMVQEVLFGLEASMEGIRFRPYIPAQVHREILQGTASVELRNVNYRGTRNTVLIRFPEQGLKDGVGVAGQIKLNGEMVAEGFVETDRLQPDNRWEIELKARADAGELDVVDLADEARLFRRFEAELLPDPGPPVLEIAARDMSHRGGDLKDDHHFQNWGREDHELESKAFAVGKSGSYLLRAEFANGSGPVNTGISCAVKKVEVEEVESGEMVASGYWIMPQSGDWGRWDLSSALRVDMRASKEYRIRLSEDDYSRNMSYLQKNERYTVHPGGGAEPYNYVNIASFRVYPARP